MRQNYYKVGMAVCAIVLFVVCIGCQSGKKAAESSAPKIAALENTHNFGRVKQGEQVEHIFKIKNEGTGELVIKGAKGSKGFKASVMTTGAIPAGGEGEVKVLFQTKNRLGKTSGKVTVMSNDKANPKLALSIEAEVFTDVAVKPKAVSFGKMGKSEKAVRDFSLTVGEPEKIKITNVASMDPRFTVTLKEGAPGGSATYEVAFNGSDKIERITSKIMVEYQGSDKPSLEIPLSVSLEGDLRFPKRVYFDKKDGVFEPKEISFSSRSGKVVEIKSVEDADKKLKTKIKTRKGETAVILAEVADPAAVYDETEKHILKVNTMDKDEPVVEITYKIMEKQKRSREAGGEEKSRPTARVRRPNNNPSE